MANNDKRKRPASSSRSPPAKRARTVRSKSARSTSAPPAAKSKSPSPTKKLRVGILLTYPKLEMKKEELLKYNRNELKDRPWLKLVDKKFVMEREWRREKKLAPGKRHPLGRVGIPGDVAVGCYLQHAYKNKNVEIDMIMPHEITPERLKANDLNFMIIYDLLESFHTDKTRGKKLYHNLKECVEKADNIFPPKEYQEFVGSKITYYNYLTKNNISIAPTITMTAEEYKAMTPQEAVDKVISHALDNGWKRFICKPVLGQEAIDARFFVPDEKTPLRRYLARCMKKYPGIVIQKEIKDFGNSRKSPEIRMYYIGNKYHYSISAQENMVLRPREEGGTFVTPLHNLKRQSKKILKQLPAMVMPNGKKLPRFLARIDMGYIVDGNYNPFVNEVEYVPGLYADELPHSIGGKRLLIESILGDQMVKITKQYVK
jgi:hypothetical protein